MLFSSKAVASASKIAARGFHASARAEARKFFVGGKKIVFAGVPVLVCWCWCWC